jgi:hypothetical protein
MKALALEMKPYTPVIQENWIHEYRKRTEHVRCSKTGAKPAGGTAVRLIVTDARFSREVSKVSMA